jgi:peptidoglycan hydrolase FlgJ
MSIEAISSLRAATPSSAMFAARDPGLGAASARPGAEDVKKAAKQFEAILVRQLLAPAIEPMMKGSFGGSGAGAGVYGYMLTDVLANSVSQGGGLGLAAILESQLSPRADASSDPVNHE